MSLSKNIKEQMVKDFGQNPQDTGSVEVQIAMLTEHIRLLTQHLKEHAKDSASKRGLLKLVARRRTFLRYLERKNPEKYKKMIEQLKLKK